MNIIRDEELHGIMMIPLFHQYGVHYCHVKDCPYKASTLLMGTGTEIDPIGICEFHYEQSKQEGKFKFTLDPNKDQSFKPVE
jgi:hypothetical protein